MNHTSHDEPVPRIQMEPDFEETWPGASRLAAECILNLSALVQSIEAFGQSLVRRHGIPSSAAFNVLEILRGAGEPLPPSTIAERMIVSRQTMTGILDALERRDLVRRMPHQSDRRMTLIEITAEGRARTESLLPELHEAETRLMAHLSEDEQRSLLHMIATLQTHVPPALTHASPDTAE